MEGRKARKRAKWRRRRRFPRGVVGFSGDGTGYRMEGRKARKRARCRRRRRFPGCVVGFRGNGIG